MWERRRLHSPRDFIASPDLYQLAVMDAEAEMSNHEGVREVGTAAILVMSHGAASCDEPNG